MKKAKKIIGIAVDILIVLVIILALVVSITSLTAKANDGVPDLFGRTAFTIKTDSMEPTIKEGDYILGKKCDDPTALKVGDIITFKTIEDGQRIYNTHRIIEVENEGTILSYRTKGDNSPEADESSVAPGDIVSVWKDGDWEGARIPLFGSAVEFLSGKVGFFIFIILPILLYTVWQVYKLIYVVMHNQKIQILEEQKDNEEMIKKQAVEEYLAQQKKDADRLSGDSDGEKTSESENGQSESAQDGNTDK